MSKRKRVAMELLLLDAIETLFTTHPEPERLRRAWKTKLEKYEALRAGQSDESARSVALLAKILLKQIPDDK